MCRTCCVRCPNVSFRPVPPILKADLTLRWQSTTVELRLESFEMIFIRVLHLLAHHPDFAVTEEALPDIAK